MLELLKNWNSCFPAHLRHLQTLTCLLLATWCQSHPAFSWLLSECTPVMAAGIGTDPVIVWVKREGSWLLHSHNGFIGGAHLNNVGCWFRSNHHLSPPQQDLCAGYHDLRVTWMISGRVAHDSDGSWVSGSCKDSAPLKFRPWISCGCSVMLWEFCCNQAVLQAHLLSNVTRWMCWCDTYPNFTATPSAGNFPVLL